MHQRTLIVADVAATMLHRYGMQPTPQALHVVSEIEKRAVEQLQDAYRGHPDLRVIHSEELTKGFREKMHHETLPVVSLDDIHVKALELQDVHLFSHARAFDLQTRRFVMARRANHPSLRRQDRLLVERLEGKKVALMDTGIYGGSQLINVIRRLHNRGISVRKVYVGIVRWRGYTRFVEKLKELSAEFGHDIRFVPVLGDRGAGQNWMFDMRDMISGRNVIEGAEHRGILTYAHAPELVLPNPHRMSATNRRAALDAIRGDRIKKIAETMLRELADASPITGIHFEPTGIYVRPLSRGNNRRSRKVEVWQVRNAATGKTW